MLSLSSFSDANLATAFAKCAVEPVHAVDPGGFSTPPKRFRRTSCSTVVGSGDIDFELGRALLLDWRQFPGDWAHAVADGPTEPGQHVAVLARCFGIYVMNVCRVVEVAEYSDENSATFSIIYATVASHDLVGAEAFELIWNRHSNDVCYRVTSYARPRSLIARVCYLYIRSLQRRFVAESCETVRRLISRAGIGRVRRVEEPVSSS